MVDKGRRRFVRKFGGVASTLVGMSLGVNSTSADRGEKIGKKVTEEQRRKLRKGLRANYDKKTAAKAGKIIIREAEKHYRGHYESEEAFGEAVTQRLKKDKHAAEVAIDYQQAEIRANRSIERDLESVEVSTEATLDASKRSGSMTTLPLLSRSTDVEGSGGAIAQAIPKEGYFDSSVQIEADGALYGSCHAEVIRSTYFTPDKTGTWKFDWDYSTSGMVKGSATTLIEIIVDNNRKEVVRDLSSDATTSGTASKWYSLNAGERYKVGMKYRVAADAFISAGTARFIDGGYIQPTHLQARAP